MLNKFQIKPFANEHSARIHDPDRYVRFRRENNAFGEGIDVIWGILEDESAEIQAIRFDAGIFTADEARQWLEEHGYDPISFEEATDEEENKQDNTDNMKIPKFDTRKELFDFLQENKSTLAAQKKAEMKKADAISFISTCIDKEGKEHKGAIFGKANSPVNFEDLEEIKVKVVINTTNILDSHEDVHFPGIWNKSLKENKNIMHIQEHVMAFKNLISKGKDLEASVQTISWEDLGFNFEGFTQALVFESTVKRKQNKFMFEQYANGYVDQHSVGMRYVKLILCINDERRGAEYEAWEKYFPQVVNKADAEKLGYFWAVTEAKVIEGSAVLLGSNYATPTLENNMKNEPPEGTHKKDTEPPKSTLTEKEIREYFRNNLKKQ